MTESETCTACGQRPARPQVTVGELITNTRHCQPCWDEKIALLKSGQLEQQAQAQHDKVMRDLKNGVEPLEAWKRRDEKDD